MLYAIILTLKSKGRDSMFKRLKKDRGKILLIFLLEALIVVGALAAIISLYHIEFVEKYSLFILLSFLIVAHFFNVFNRKVLIWFVNGSIFAGKFWSKRRAHR